MAKLFDIVGTKVTPEARVIAIPAMKKIWDRDKSKGKERAFKEYSYITFLVDFHSPYRDLSEDIKEKTIIKDVFGDDSFKKDDVIIEAIKKYEQLQETRHMRLLKSYEHIEDEITKYNMQVDLSKLDDWGKPIYDPKTIQNSAKEIGNTVKSLAILEKQVQTEIAESSSVRGQSEIGPYEL